MEVSMAARSKNLLVHLASLPDPRERRGQRHLLLDVLVIGVLATLCGVDEWEGIEDFAVEEEAWLRTFLELPNGVPSHDTFNRIFRMIDVGAFNACFLEWVKALRKKVSKDVVAIDGKTLRGSGDDEQSPLHMVSQTFRRFSTFVCSFRRSEKQLLRASSSAPISSGVGSENRAPSARSCASIFREAVVIPR
jgi:hypothetical protein